MKRRTLLLGAGAIAAVGWMKPRDHGAPYPDYFRALNEELKKNGPHRPALLLDLDALDHNIDVVTRSIRAPKHFRIVSKSLPSIPLLDYVMKRAGTKRLMSFHQTLLNLEAAAFTDADILLGKPLPAASAARFYREHRGKLDPARQLQWLIDTPLRLQEYAELARGLNTRLRINLELDVGLHRGGVTPGAPLDEMLTTIGKNAAQLEFAGFMGYDPHIAKALFGREYLFDAERTTYVAACDQVRRDHAALWNDGLTLNGAGSPTYKLHENETFANDLSVGSGLVKPSDFDLDTLVEHKPALYIATPVLKAQDGLRLPGVEGLAAPMAAWNPNLQKTYFIYGGRWMAHFEAPAGLVSNGLALSSNQEMVNGSAATALAVDDHAFLRPTQSEALMQQFGPLVVLRGGRVVDSWPVLPT